MMKSYQHNTVREKTTVAAVAVAVRERHLTWMVSCEASGEATEAGSRAAADFWRCAQEAGFRALCEALSFSGLQQELPRLFVNGVTVIAPSDAAFAQLSPAAWAALVANRIASARSGAATALPPPLLMAASLAAIARSRASKSGSAAA